MNVNYFIHIYVMYISLLCDSVRYVDYFTLDVVCALGKKIIALMLRARTND